MQAIIIFTILSLFQISVAIKLTESKLSRCLVTMNSASDFGRLVRSPRSVAITASLSVLFLSQPISESILAQIPSLQTIAPSTVCHADSTGKVILLSPVHFLTYKAGITYSLVQSLPLASDTSLAS